MKCLSVRQPHVYRIIHAGKDIENRTWRTHHRGPLLIHAGMAWDVDAVIDERETALRGTDAMPIGCIVGVVDVVGCVTESDSPWFYGRFGWVLANPRPLERPVPYKGMLGLFEVPDILLEGLV